MKYSALIIGLSLVCVSTFDGRINKSIWSYKDGNYDFAFNFENEVFNVDTFDTFEGHIYYFTFPNDSSYIRMNYITGNTTFECCEDSVHQEIESCKKNGIIDRNGVLVGSNLYWRAIRDYNLDIVYDYCPKEKIDYFNRILDNVLPKLKRK